jgi:RNA polymerase sigma-70 factor (ECF subfamily)
VRSDAPFQDLLAAARKGDEPALATLYRRLQPALLGYLHTQRPNDADDLASETWIAAARGLERFRGDEEDFRRWMFTIARRRLLDLYRDEARRPAAATRGAAAETAGIAPDAATEAIQAADVRFALSQIASLPADEAEVVVLRVVAGLSAKDVAEITGRTTVGVRVVQHRALKRLAGFLEKSLVTLVGAAAM